MLKSKCSKKVYIGSTTQSLKERLRCHYKEKESNNITSKLLLKYNDCEIVLLLDYPCNNKKELRKKEGEYIKKYNCVNKKIAGRTKKEYKEDNKDYYKIKQKKYYNKNKDKLLKYAENYRTNNREKMINYLNEYRINNKDKLKKLQKQYIQCDICNCKINKYRQKRHEQTKKHKKKQEEPQNRNKAPVPIIH
jgi:hypothetical protein